MSYWIPFRKKEENSQDKAPVAMLSFETMIRLHEMAEDLSQNEPSLLSPGNRQGSCAFFCGNTDQKDIGRKISLSEENVIRMKKKQVPEYIPSPEVFSNASLSISFRPASPVQSGEYTYIAGRQKAAFSCTILGVLYFPAAPITIRASAQGNSYGRYLLKDQKKNPRTVISLKGNTAK